MKHQRMTREAFEQAFEQTLGAWNPVGHAVLAFENDEVTGQARTALRDAGLGDEDILVFTSDELEPPLNKMLRAASGATGFGFESTLMRRYLALAQEGVGWLIVYADEDGATERVAEVAERFKARTAVRYRALISEELV